MNVPTRYLPKCIQIDMHQNNDGLLKTSTLFKVLCTKTSVQFKSFSESALFTKTGTSHAYLLVMSAALFAEQILVSFSTWGHVIFCVKLVETWRQDLYLPQDYFFNLLLSRIASNSFFVHLNVTEVRIFE